jgi:cyclopropane-fatty-acyl-phospholipid synthase
LGITLSESQAIEARRRISEAGLGRRCEVRVLDYRDLDDQPFDKVASVGMYEHVGRALLETYVRRLHALTRPGGLILNHGIARLDDAVSSPTSFIRHYVFPDGELHPVSALIDHLHAAGLELRDVESLREHYPLTLRRWLANLAHNRDEAIAVAGAERERVWRLYMAGSAIAFDRGDIGVYQTVAARPGGRSRVARTREQWSAAPPAVRLAAA